MKTLWYFILTKVGLLRCSGYRVYPNGIRCYGCGDCSDILARVLLGLAKLLRKVGL